MGKSVSITVHPSALGAEYLTVSDAMHQMLDLVAALENTESGESSSRQIVWRLKEAHTNSPPFTITAEAFPVDPDASIRVEAIRVAGLFAGGVRELLEGRDPAWLADEVIAPLKRALRRNVNGVGRSEIAVEDNEPFNILPQNARTAIATLERREIAVAAMTPDYSRTEYGAVEVEVFGITRWNDKPALAVQERLSQHKLTCVLAAELAADLGPQHKWNEAWEGRRLLVGGELHYARDGSLWRIDATTAEVRPWTDVSLSDIRDIDILEGRSVSEHLRLLRGEDRG